VLQTGAVRIFERGTRVHSPAFSEGLLRIFGPSGIAEGGVHTVWFLFRGQEPLDIVIDAESPIEFQLPVTLNRPGLARSTQEIWWTQYNLQMRRQIEAGEYPQIAEVYLLAMLANRLNRRELFSPVDALREQNELQQTIDLIFAAERVRTQAIRQMMYEPKLSRADASRIGKRLSRPTENNQAEGAANEDQSPLSVPLPSENNWQSWPTLQLDDGIQIEALAHAVPEECFYLHFGTWDNQVWLKRLLDERGNDLARVISMRGYQPASDTKIFDQLVLESSQLDEMFGGQLVADVAIIGRDFYVQEGPAIGVLFQSKGDMFHSNMNSRRSRFARSQAAKGVTLQKLEIAGNEVTFLSTPDNLVRSFYAAKDDFHLVTTSRTMVERFFEAIGGHRSLAQHIPFRYARAELPLSREDTVFFYLSSRFFEAILSPQFQIELARRSRALASIQLLQMAAWAANSEGVRSDSLENLQTHGFLPTDFGVQVDGSTVKAKDGLWFDTLRGRRGYFTPVCDVDVPMISQGESVWLDQRQSFYQRELGSMNPIFGAIKRYELERPRGEKAERVVFDARVAPFGGKQWEMLAQYLGPPMQSEITMSPDDLVSAQLSMRAVPFLAWGSSEPHQLFLAIQSDVSPTPPPLTSGGFFQTLQILKTIPGYLGAWPSPGYLDMLPALGGRPDEAGFTYSRILDLWRLRHGDFSVLAFDRGRLEQLRPSLAVVPADRPAQVRLRVNDLANSNMRYWINSFYYQQGWKSSLANVRFMHMLAQQFNIPAEACLEAAENILDVKLVCPLDGRFEFVDTASGRQLWRSNAWPEFGNPQVPEEFQAPPLSWFRGMSLDAYMQQSQFVLHGYVDLERRPTSRLGSLLPSFKSFKGFNPVEELPPAIQDDDQPDKPQQDQLLPPRNSRKD
ncbi:MAG TPA: hypothetical protein PKA76_17405, partial [Pirellulaceae bacterium]|nr:hypothetical protein [Pirellulaceae bacterium]